MRLRSRESGGSEPTPLNDGEENGVEAITREREEEVTAGGGVEKVPEEEEARSGADGGDGDRDEEEVQEESRPSSKKASGWLYDQRTSLRCYYSSM